MTNIILGIIAIAINYVILFFVIRKASRSNESLKALNAIIESGAAAEEKSNVVKLTEERKARGVDNV